MIYLDKYINIVYNMGEKCLKTFHKYYFIKVYRLRLKIYLDKSVYYVYYSFEKV